MCLAAWIAPAIPDGEILRWDMPGPVEFDVKAGFAEICFC
jgi:hypothetical protein